MNIKTSLLVGIFCLGSTLAQAAESAYLHIRMSGQGYIAGSSSKKGYEHYWALASVVPPRDHGISSGRRVDKGGLSSGSTCSLSDLDHEIVSPRDTASGLPTGKRQHQPHIVCNCSFDRVGQQLMQALVGNERCVELTVCIVGDDGKTRTGVVSDPELEMVSFAKSENGMPPTEEISFTYSKIEWK